MGNGCRRGLSGKRHCVVIIRNSFLVCQGTLNRSVKSACDLRELT
jgi:hypothetical protein